MKKRVNIDLDAELWRQAKVSAVGSGLSLREWLTQAIKEKLEHERSGKMKGEAQC